jgi:hypothetical protein
MNDGLVLKRLRLFLLAVSGVLFAGSLLELYVIGHWEDVVQFIPFGLCGLGLVAVLAVWVWPHRISLLALRGVMVGVVLGSLFGIYEHISNNFAFELEIQPNEAISTALMHSLAGANPLLAPGVLALAAVLAIAATYYHPAMQV